MCTYVSHYCYLYINTRIYSSMLQYAIFITNPEKNTYFVRMHRIMLILDTTNISWLVY